MNGFFTLDQSLSLLIIVTFLGIVLLWFAARAVRAIAREMYHVARTQENIAREQFENDLIRTRWQVWRSYTNEIIGLADWFNQIRSAYIKDPNADLVIKYDQNGAEMIWAFGYEEIGVEVSTMGEIVENLMTQIRPPMAKLREAWKLEGAEREIEIHKSWSEVENIWDSVSPRILRKLKEIELKIRAKMPLHTEPLPLKERERLNRKWLKAEQSRQKKPFWNFFRREKKENDSILKL
ncbi:hypothetical protein FAI40_04295 [Acetobacteraceae bacterium]|nr:hypothetical protein FAI40_04295 [Acetobacteraceae bacterium]